MTEEFAKKLCCPIDNHDLDIKIFMKHDDGEIIEALLTCSECSRYFPVIYGVPIMTPDEYRDTSLEAPLLKKWNLSLPDDSPEPFLLDESSS
ncbi:MAG: hypothetical protein R6V27_05455 [Balneolaceae bacterium]